MAKYNVAKTFEVNKLHWKNLPVSKTFSESSDPAVIVDARKDTVPNRANDGFVRKKDIMEKPRKNNETAS